jgi:hypothetical protein
MDIPLPPKQVYRGSWMLRDHMSHGCRCYDPSFVGKNPSSLPSTTLPTTALPTSKTSASPPLPPTDALRTMMHDTFVATKGAVFLQLCSWLERMMLEAYWCLGELCAWLERGMLEAYWCLGAYGEGLWLLQGLFELVIIIIIIIF